MNKSDLVKVVAEEVGLTQKDVTAVVDALIEATTKALVKGEEEITLYGPIRYRSIYSLAEQALSLNLYEEGTAAWSFLKQLITDGDNPPQETPQPEEAGEESEE